MAQQHFKTANLLTKVREINEVGCLIRVYGGGRDLGGCDFCSSNLTGAGNLKKHKLEKFYTKKQLEYAY